MKNQRTLVRLAVAVTVSLACGGVRTVSRDGYRAQLVFGGQEKYAIAVRGEKKRVEGDFDGSQLVKIQRADLKRVWQFRPSTKKLLEEPWQPTDEIVPGYPLDPGFDPHAYADRFRATVQRIDDGIAGIHPCERYLFTLPSSDLVTVWVARDLERLPVKVEQRKRRTRSSPRSRSWSFSTSVSQRTPNSSRNRRATRWSRAIRSWGSSSQLSAFSYQL